MCSHTHLVANHKDILTLFLSLLCFFSLQFLRHTHLTVAHALTRIECSSACPLVQRLGHLPLEQVIGVRIPGGQPNIIQCLWAFPDVPHVRLYPKPSLCPYCVRICLKSAPKKGPLRGRGRTCTISWHFRLSSLKLRGDCPLIRTGRKGLWVTFAILLRRSSKDTSAKPTWPGS